MTTADRIIFVYGVFATLLLLGGLLYTIRDFREMGRNPEKYVKKHYPEKENTDT